MKEICYTLLTDTSKIECANNACFWEAVGGSICVVLICVIGYVIYKILEEI